MKLKQDGIICKIYKFTLNSSEYHRLTQTNFCHLVWSLLLALPLALMGVLILAFAMPFIAVGEGIESLRNTRAPKGPSKLKLWWDTVHGKICPIVYFE